MIKKVYFRFPWLSSLLIIALFISSCSGGATSEGQATEISSLTPTEEVVSTPTHEDEHGATVADEDVLYHDDFTNPATGWPEEKFDNFFIGYHEPEYYHVEITSPNYKTTVFEPEKQSYGDVTIEVKAFSALSRTAETGDFSFGPVFRRSGDQYYAFVVSQRAKKWYVLKSSPTALTVLAEGTDEGIHDPDVEDVLRVDAQGASFTFSINDQVVGQVTDADYASGEVGFFVQSFDVPAVHVHFDELTVRNYAGPASPDSEGALYHDDFTNPATGWPEEKFDNFFIGYHEPEYYHVEITSPNYKTTVFEPGKQSYGDVTIEVKAFSALSRTAETGDFSFGPVFRRSGDQYYAFVVSQRAKKWYVLKSSPTALTVLAEGTDEGIHDPDVEDVLRVDAQGASFTFSINDQVVGQVTDADYASGEVGFFVQSFDVPAVHVHFDELTIKPLILAVACDVRAQVLRVRSGPGTDYSSSVYLRSGETVQPIGRSADGEWLLIAVGADNNKGWIFSSAEFLTCNDALGGLPIVSP
ncbi:MAG TPA: SH3 domain-containing protein [Anaerolineales bacterium]|nr:SH3 domain-containing protein [Anaerolineales bacterium]